MSALIKGNQFWKHFEQQEATIRQCLINQDYETLFPIVEALDEEVYENFGTHFFVENTYGEFEATFDTGPNKTCQYLGNMLVRLAPNGITKKWILHETLPPLSQKAIQAQVQIKDGVYTLSDFYAFYEVDDNSQTVSVKIYCPAFSLIDNDENKRLMSLYLLELALGQKEYEAYISNVTYLDQPDRNLKFCELMAFYDTLCDMAEEKGWKFYDSALDIYSVYQPYQDFAHDSLRKDMKIIFTTNPLLIETTLEKQGDVLLDMEAKQGEYGFIYYSNPYNNQQDAIYRQTLTKQFSDMFEKYPVARVIGGAMGKSYSYIDVAIFDRQEFDKLFARIQKQLRDNVKLHYSNFKDVLK